MILVNSVVGGKEIWEYLQLEVFQGFQERFIY